MKLFEQINGLKVRVETSERKQFSGTPCTKQRQRQRQLISRRNRTKVCRNCNVTPSLHGNQVTRESLVSWLWKGNPKITRTHVKGQFNGAPLKDVIVSGIKGHIWSYEIFNVWLKNQDAIVDLDKIKTLKYNCLE